MLPGSTDVEGFWRDVVTGRDLITDVPASHWLVEDYYDPDPSAPDKTYARRGAFLAPIDFDPTAFGIPPNIMPATDTAQLLALVAAEKVLQDATGGDLSTLDRERISVLLGTSSQQLLYEMASRLQRPVWRKALRESGIEEGQAQDVCDRIAAHYVPWQEATFPGLLGNVIAGRIANRFDLHGTNSVSDAACASSLSAIWSASNELALGQADLAIAGGVDTMNDILMFMCFSKTPALSPTGDCRPFSDAADGTMLGEGLVLFALKRLDDAERDGDRIYAVIRGLGSSSDGRGSAIYAPVPEGQARALRRAYQAAGYGPRTVELVEAHGTGTKAGDAAELAALRAVFEQEDRTGARWCALGSVKSQIGHTKSTAGAAGLLKAVLAVQHGILPPTIKVDRPNPRLDLEHSAFYLNTVARPWVRDPGQPRRAGVSSFGFGGSNFHATLEEYRPSPGSNGVPARPARTVPTELILIAADSTTELAVHCRRLPSGAASLATLARESQLGFRQDAPVRLAVSATDLADLRRKLEQAASAMERSPDESFSAPTGLHVSAASAAPGQLAFVFSGQGSQYVGMGADVAMHFPQARSVWDASASRRFDGRAVHEVVFPVPAFSDAEREAQTAALTATEWAQPALAIQSLALLAVLRTLGVAPDCVGGHSFGELVALHAAGAFDADTLIALARRRGELMRDAPARPGAMSAVRATLADVESALGRSGGNGVWVANHNAPTQVVVSGNAESVGRLEDDLAAQGIGARRLMVSTAFHTPLVAPAGVPLLDFLTGLDIGAPRIDVYRNAEVSPYSADPDQVRRGLSTQVGMPVRFVEEIEAMYARGVRTFVEVGAGSVLTDLVGQILAGRDHLAVSLDRTGRNGVTSLYDALGRLAVAGVRLSFGPLWTCYRPQLTEPPKTARIGVSTKITGANYGRPYPPAGGPAELPPPNPPRPDPVSAPSPAAAPTAAVDAGWLRTFETLAQQTAESHAAYERMMADSHAAFLRLAEASFAGMAAALGDLPTPTSPPQPPAPQHLDRRSTQQLPAVLPGPAEPRPASVESRAVPSPPVPPPASSDGATATPEPVPDLEELLISIVAERTGYPAEMLGAHQELEADLGVDSIKRVEILSAMRQRLPGLPELSPADLGKLRTIGQIGERLRGASTGPASSTEAVVPEPVGSPGSPAASRQAEPVALVRLEVRAVAAPEPGYPIPGLGDGPLVVTDDGRGVAKRLVEALHEYGIAARVVDEVPSDSKGVVYLGGLRDVDSTDQALEVNREAFRAARAIAPRFQSEGGVFVTVQDTGGSFGLDGATLPRVWLAGAAALARTAAHEWPLAAVKAIDCECAGRDPQAIATALLRELLHGGSTLDVGLRADGTRLTLEPAQAVTEPDPAPRIGPDSVIVASGGARGVTAAALVALARRYRPRLVLVGRTPLVDESEELREATDERALRRVLIERARREGASPVPARIGAELAAVMAGREVRRTMAELAAAGSLARYLAIDVRDQSALTDALAEVRREWGPLTGIVHGAGVLADKLIADQTDEQYDRVFDTKVEGLRALLAATADDPLQLLVVFTSVSAKVGNPGQSAYAMANSVISQVASAVADRRPACLVRAIAWGPWQGGMVSAELEEHFRRQGVPLIPVADGAHAFLSELESSDRVGRVIISAGSRAGLVTVGGEHRALDIRLGSSQPYLADHSLAGSPVVPVALVGEWLVRAARAERRLGDPVVLRDLRVLRGVTLDGLPDRERVLQLRSRVEAQEGGQRLSLELRDNHDNIAYYRSGTDLAPQNAEPPQWTVPDELEPPGRSPLYDGDVLFHGPRFQAIRTLHGVSAAGASAEVCGVRGLGWPAGEEWQTDPAAVDGGLQVALLWAERVLGGASLPMAVAEYRIWRAGLAPGPIRCLVRARAIHASNAECDIACLDEDGSLRAELLGVELVRRPDQPVR
jgi:acyl transferase domain-containing protein/NADP-dependent 3-hydroxy acid dehydrogenase YdfG